MDPKQPKIRVFKVFPKLLALLWISRQMKDQIIGFVPEQIPYLEKPWFLS